MSGILSTEEIKHLIESNFVKKLEEILEKEIRLSNIFFDVGKDNSKEGTYIFTNEKGYNCVYTEKGKIRKHDITNNIFLIVYWVMDNVIFDFAMEYATKHRVNGEDFRQKLFQKEKEIWKKLSKEGYEMKLEEIEKILQENPYTVN